MVDFCIIDLRVESIYWLTFFFFFLIIDFLRVESIDNMSYFCVTRGIWFALLFCFLCTPLFRWSYKQRSITTSYQYFVLLVVPGPQMSLVLKLLQDKHTHSYWDLIVWFGFFV